MWGKMMRRGWSGRGFAVNGSNPEFLHDAPPLFTGMVSRAVGGDPGGPVARGPPCGDGRRLPFSRGRPIARSGRAARSPGHVRRPAGDGTRAVGARASTRAEGPLPALHVRADALAAPRPVGLDRP